MANQFRALAYCKNLFDSEKGFLLAEKSPSIDYVALPRHF
ncbi:hypothetical protein LEP1GSC050_2509 [Leptospira broomii serovar Hurstbridge str. 5399]|uniref:Uncharacterized protein n=1 Tax=Leptospira broomii serovar Hurstbridge str. 5399 TaxID=1049789 RepID=T0F9F4_9LEPT|nr:hypothetical protein LEP1GSC050_2509 [Leptospira broomii serovar Hurstbridge str. 5399]